MIEFRKSFDREKALPCLKIHCNRLILFMKFYPVAEKDIIWFGEVIEALTVLRRPKEIKLRDETVMISNDHECLIELKEEYERILGQGKWRYTTANYDYSLCPSYSKVLPIPESLNDTVLMHASRYRVQNRFPLIANIFEGNALIRSGQPLTGLTQKRCIQDEKLIEAIKQNTGHDNKKIMIVDARPSTSALANTLIGAGIERLECYEGSERVYLNLENIHTIRESHDRLSQQLKGSNGQRTLWIEIEEGCAWLDHLRGILDGIGKIVESLKSAHVLVHCSDGWDRTSQLISLTQLCLFPEYRTKQGFKKLIKKDWLSTGHRFSDRNNHHVRVALTSRLASAAVTKNPWNSIKTFLEIDSTNPTNPNNSSSTNNDPFTSEHECPIFLQFIEAMVQLCRQFPLHFMELTDDFLLKIVDEAYTGDVESEFFGNCEAERIRLDHKLKESAESLQDQDVIHNSIEEDSIIIPFAERSKMILWPAYYKRFYPLLLNQ